MRRAIVWSLVLLTVIMSVGLVAGAPTEAVPGGSLDTHDDVSDPPMLGISACAETPPPDFAPPDENVLGWYGGYWYNQPIDVDTTDGLTQAELDKVVARSMARWEALRCLPFKEDVPVEVIDRETFREEHTSMNVSPETRAFENARAMALFMVGQDEDAVEVLAANRGESVGGFYSIDRQQIVLVSGESGEIHVNEPILGHELGHALQDQHFGLEGFAGSTTDEHNANLGIVEGDVVFTDTVYEAHCDDGVWAGDCIMPPSDRSPPDLASIGLFLITFQPYSDGPNFVSSIYDAGGWDAVNAVYDAYPTSSKAVMYPELYSEFTPAHPAFVDRSSDRWDILDQSHGERFDHLGEPTLFASLIAPGFDDPTGQSVIEPLQLFNFDHLGDLDPFNPYNYSHEYTAGWVGDRFVAYAESGVALEDDPALAYTLEVAFEDESSATAFADAWREHLTIHGAVEVNDESDAVFEIADTDRFDGAYHLDRTNSDVLVVFAPTVEELEEVYSADRVDDEPPAEAIPGFTVGIVAVGLLSAGALLLRRRR